VAIDDSPTKTAAGGISIYLMEELTDARLRCEQLKRYIGDAVKLIEQSPHRDHFFEVAGHLLHGIPESLFKLDKALSATALAASKMDYDELALALKPEKVEELERVLEDSRIRHVTRRSGDPQMTPKDTAQAIRAMATDLEKTGRFPIKAAAELVAILREEQPNVRLASMPSTLPPVMLTALADAIENGTLRNRERLSAMIDTAITQALGGQKMQALLQQAGSREDVMDGFKKENPALTDEQLEEIADQWEANKDVVKDKTAAKVVPLAEAKKGDRVEFTYKGEKLTGKVFRVKKDGVVSIDPESDDVNDGALIDVRPPKKTAGAGAEFQKANPAITDEQVKIIDEMHDKHKDVVKNKHQAANLSDDLNARVLDLAAGYRQAEADLELKAAAFWKAWKVVEKPQGGGVKNMAKQIIGDALDVQSTMRKQIKQIDNMRSMAWIDVRVAAEGDNVSKFTEGEPADPTVNMTDEQKAEWEKQRKLHENEFKPKAP